MRVSLPCASSGSHSTPCTKWRLDPRRPTPCARHRSIVHLAVIVRVPAIVILVLVPLLPEDVAVVVVRDLPTHRLGGVLIEAEVDAAVDACVGDVAHDVLQVIVMENDTRHRRMGDVDRMEPT